MGVGQNATAGLATTMLAAGAMIGKVGADIDKANVAKAEEADKIQEGFLQNKEAMQGIEGEHEKLSALVNTAQYGESEDKAAASSALRDKGLTDAQAAQRALDNLRDKHEALQAMNERYSERFTKLTHRGIIGGEE